MKRLFALTLVLVVAAAVTAADRGDKKDKAEALKPEQLVGTWHYTAGTKQGEKIGGDELKKQRAIFTKDTVTLPLSEDQKFVIGYKLVPNTSPQAIDMEIKDGPVKEGKAVGIIALEKGKLKLCYAMVEPKDRPKKFESTEANKAFYFEMEKSKAGQK